MDDDLEIVFAGKEGVLRSATAVPADPVLCFWCDGVGCKECSHTGLADPALAAHLRERQLAARDAAGLLRRELAEAGLEPDQAAAALRVFGIWMGWTADAVDEEGRLLVPREAASDHDPDDVPF